MKTVLGIVLAVIFAFLGLLHFYWATGGQGGVGAAIPSIGDKPVFQPSPASTVMVGVALLVAMATVLGQLGYLGQVIPPWVFRWATLGLAALFFIRSIGEFRLVGFFKQASDSAFAWWDTYLFSPLCLFIAVAAFLISYRK